MKKLKIAMAGGGTGGHVFPIKSLIEYIEIKPEFLSKISNIYRFGSKHSLEQDICHRLIKQAQESHTPYDIKFISIFSGKYRRETPISAKIKNLRDIFLFLVGVLQAIYFLIFYKIDVVFCKGGFVALPVVLAGKILRKKIIVHESDTHSGLVNKIASKFADETFTGFAKVLPGADVVGQILSDDIIYKPHHNSKDSINRISNKSETTQILVVGGSQGSQRLYQSIIKAVESDKSIQNDFEFHVILGLLNKDLKQHFDKFPNIKTYDFVSQKEMGELCYNCDIAITRAGTTSLAEQKLYDMKLFIVPIAWTHDQYDNAYWYQEHYNDIMIDQKDENFLNKLVMEIKKHKGFKKVMVNKNILSMIHVAKQKICEAIIN